MDLDTGELLWSKQMTAGDLFNMSCVTPTKLNCPDPQGPDFDIGTSAALVKLDGGRRALVFGQKTGEVHAIDPDAEGRLLWTTRIGKGGILGGIQWGHAADDRHVYASLSDIAFLDEGMGDYRTLVADPKAGGGLFAIELATGNSVWHAPPSPCGKREACTPAQMSAIAVVPGVVFRRFNGRRAACSRKQRRQAGCGSSIRSATLKPSTGFPARAGQWPAAARRSWTACSM